MFVNDEDFAFVGSVFFNFGKPYICKGKAVHAQKAKSLLRQNITKMQWTLFRVGRIFRQNKLQGTFQKDVGHFCNICNGTILQ